ncbi:hypothetical protein [Solibacillus sp.]|uniref:hypothetical protein n=1 Tax=Solibacillus sp. TaxID=1909654 RepID=UPI00331621B4
MVLLYLFGYLFNLCKKSTKLFVYDNHVLSLFYFHKPEEAAETTGVSSTTVIRRFKNVVQTMPKGVMLPKVIAIDEYKADTDTGKYQLIIADAKNASTNRYFTESS